MCIKLGSRVGGDADARTSVVSFRKSKRIRGEAAAVRMRRQHVDLDAESTRAPTKFMQMFLLMRKKPERKDEVRRRDEREERDKVAGRTTRKRTPGHKRSSH